jgi:hypothetical protein
MFGLLKKLIILFIIMFAAFCYVKNESPTDAAKDIDKTTKTIHKSVKRTGNTVNKEVKKAKNEYNGVKEGYKICSDKFGTSHPLDFIDCIVGGST